MADPQPFDSRATTYDATFTHTAIGHYLRERVHARLDLHFRAGDHVLELGCGTGEDALHLAGRGVHVLATDASEAMLAVARAKAQGNPLVRFAQLDLRSVGAIRESPLQDSSTSLFGSIRAQHAVPLQPQPIVFNGAFANFGPVNALDNWRSLALGLADGVKPGGIVGLGVMGPLCLWETAWHALHGDFKTAFRRWNGRATFQAGDSAAPMTVYYPSIARIERDFAPHFRCTHIEPVGLFLPPSDAFAVIEKRPRLLRLLTALEDCSTRFAPLARFADHYWIEFIRL